MLIVVPWIGSPDEVDTELAVPLVVQLTVPRKIIL